MDNIYDLNQIEDKQFVFGTLFVITNKLQTLLDRIFANYNMTTKQWFLSTALESLFDSPPTLKEVADAVGYSHQNVKQVALKLQQKDFLKIEKDKYDGRAIRLELTEKSDLFWEKMQKSGEEFLTDIYKDLNNEELAVLRKSIIKILKNLDEMENKQQ